MRKDSWNNDGRKFQIWECPFAKRQKGLFLSVHVDDIMLAGKKHNFDPMWKILMKGLDLGETMFILVALNENAKQAKILLTITGICGNRGSLQEGWKSDFIQKNLKQTFLHGPMTWKVMQRNAWRDNAKWQTKQLNSYTKCNSLC